MTLLEKDFIIYDENPSYGTGKLFFGEDIAIKKGEYSCFCALQLNADGSATLKDVKYLLNTGEDQR